MDKKTQIIKNISNWKDIRKNIDSNKTIGLVMTMGNLHQGHISLLDKSIAQNDINILTIFVNPTQFNNQDDFDKYPNTIDDDIKLATKTGVDFILIFSKDELYPDNYTYKLSTNSPISQVMEGEYRPGHFNGMLTIVLKMHCLTLPTKSYFGEKDYQQYQLIKDMIEAYLLPTEVISCPIIRAENNLALSSRNNRLSKDEIIHAAKFSNLLKDENLSDEQIINKLTELDFKVDYIQTTNNRRFGAVYINDVRLIDNIELNKSYAT